MRDLLRRARLVLLLGVFVVSAVPGCSKYLDAEIHNPCDVAMKVLI